MTAALRDGQNFKLWYAPEIFPCSQFTILFPPSLKATGCAGRKGEQRKITVESSLFGGSFSPNLSLEKLELKPLLVGTSAPTFEEILGDAVATRVQGLVL